MLGGRVCCTKLKNGYKKWIKKNKITVSQEENIEWGCDEWNDKEYYWDFDHEGITYKIICNRTTGGITIIEKLNLNGVIWT